MRGAGQYVLGKCTVTVGCHNLHTGQHELKNLFDEFCRPANVRPNISWDHDANPSADPLLKGLGASAIESIDASEYEDGQLVPT
jgi:hypothetical protein